MRNLQKSMAVVANGMIETEDMALDSNPAVTPMLEFADRRDSDS